MKKVFIPLILLVTFAGCENMDKECRTLQIHCKEYGDIPCRKWADKCYMTEDFQKWKVHQDKIIKEASEEFAFQSAMSECETVFNMCLVNLDDCPELTNKETYSLDEYTRSLECKTTAIDNFECIMKYSECTNEVREKYKRPHNP